MLAFVTVGSTRFDALIQAAFSDSTLKALLRKGYDRLIVQCGNSSFSHESSIQREGPQTIDISGVQIEYWKYKPSLEEDFKRADLVISHAGAGTILEVLRMGKAMVVVPNPTLLDNHQTELADALEEMGHLRSSTVDNLPNTISQFDASTIKPFPPFDPTRFAKIVDECMGFA